jgi:hypothetical protein
MHRTEHSRVAALAMLCVVWQAGCGGSSATPSTSGSSSAATTPKAIKGISPDSPYEAGLRAAYEPVLRTLAPLAAPCDPTTIAKLPECRMRLKAFEAAVAELERYVSDTPSPADATTEARTLATSTHLMHVWFGRLGTYVEQRDVASVNAMGGYGKPLTNSLMAFTSALGPLDSKLPGKRLRLPGE